MKKTEITIPEWLLEVKYNGRIIPSEQTPDIKKTGANCQVFAYQLLRLHNLYVPNFRSSELWEDRKFSKVITTDYQPLDLLFFNKKEIAYGSHLAVFLGNNKAIHLCKKIGLPVIWTLPTFFQQPAYACLLGGKRFFTNTF